jgi:aminopeptidase 2
VVILKQTNTITLHSIELDYSEVSLKLGSGSSCKPTSTTTNKDDETVTFNFPKLLAAKSSAVLKIRYTGVILDDLQGFYRARYIGRDGKHKFGGCTQFQATAARRALPCFDEPALKATFDVTIIADKSLTCLCNMDVKSRTTADGLQTVVYNTTPIMSVYLLAFAIGEFNYAENKDFRIPVRVYTTPDRPIKQAQYAADLTSKLFKFFEAQFELEYPLPKIDCIGLADKGGAMENWGLITFQENTILYDPELTSSKNVALVSSVIAHEEGHQWFGDIVTCAWWSSLWLNESFATWSACYALSKLFPEWKSWTDFATEDLQAALKIDSLRGSHPIIVPVKNSAEIGAVFDQISYQKGGSVLRQLSAALGDKDFCSGVAQYLKAHAFSNAETADLWKAIGNVTGTDIESIMDVWTYNTGFPLLTVTEDKEAGTITIKQNRYLRSGHVKPEEDKVIWPVFLNMLTDFGVNEHPQLLNSRSATIKLPYDSDFYKLNAGHTGVYRVLYPQRAMNALIVAAQDGLLPESDRAGLLYDGIALASSGHLSTTSVFDTMESLSDDGSYFVWKAIGAWFDALNTAWISSDHSLKAAITRAQLDFTAVKAQQLGWFYEMGVNTVDVVGNLFKASMFAQAGFAGDKDIIKASWDMFRLFVAGNRKAIPIDLRSAVFGIVLKEHGTSSNYNAVLKEFEHDATTADERTNAASALGYASSSELMAKTISLALDKTRVEQKYFSAFLSGLSTHKAGVDALFETLTKHFEDVTKRFSHGIGGLGFFLPIFTRSFSTWKQADELETFFKTKDTTLFTRALRQGLEEIRIKAAWVERDTEGLQGWLEQNGYFGA